MKNALKILYLLAASLPLCFPASAGDGSYLFRTLSPEGGFYYDGVKSAVQDSEGFIWALMENDLYRFDGYQYKRYSASFREIDREEQWLYYNVTADTGGRVFVGTSKGVYGYERENDRFVKVFAGSNGTVKVDRYSNIWIKEKNRFYLVHADTLLTPTFEGKPMPYVGGVTCDYNGEFYALSRYGKIYRYDYAAMELQLCAALPELSYVVQAQTSGTTLWVLAHGGLYGFDMASYALTEHINVPFDSRVSVRDLYIDRNGQLWVATSGGLYIIDPVTKKYSHCVHEERRPFTIPNSSVWCVAGDRQNNVWIGTYAGGLCYVNLDESQAFSTYLPKEGGLNHSPVSGFAESGGYLWISTEGGGFSRMDKATGAFTCFRSGHGAGSLSSDNVKAVANEGNGNLWIATYIGGLDRYDVRTGKFKNFRHEEGNKRSLLYSNLRTIVADTASGGLWIAYQTTDVAISFLSFKDLSITHYDLDSKDSKQYIFDMALDGRGSLWVVSHSKLYRMDVKKRRSAHIPFDTTRYLYAQSVCCDKKGAVWVGTVGNGLYRYNPADSTYSVVRDVGNFSFLSIYSLCSDNEGNIWMGTDNGLFRYDALGGACSRFDKKDGVQGQVYYPLAAFRGSDGKLYFGGTDGFTVVEPRRVAFNNYMPKVIISDYFIDNKPVPMRFEKTHDSSRGATVSEVTLSHSQNNFGFRFASDNYLIPEKNMFRYRLLGYDDRWIVTDAANRTVLYSQVPAGTYYFEVAAANNDGVWSDTPAVIKIRRKAAPWFSVTAYMLYALAAGAVLYAIFYHYNGKKKLRMQLYLEGIEKDKKEQIHQSQLRFFTNISHDFRTPLSLISAALGRLKEESAIKDYYYNILNSNTTRLLNLVNELMDFRTIENNKMALKPKPENAGKVVAAITADFEEYARQRSIAFTLSVDAEMPEEIYIDRSVVEKIALNVLHNAFRYTGDGGAVTVEVYADAKKFAPRYRDTFSIKAETLPERCFGIAVRDTGVGIPSRDMESVFERFYKVSTAQADAHIGTGIGLALVKSLTLLHHGAIVLSSEQGRGTDMLISLPAGKDFYDALGLLSNGDAAGSPSESEKAAESAEGEKAAEGAKQPAHKSKRPKILLVEDNKILRTLIAESLSTAYEVAEATDGEEAANLIRNADVDLVVSDVMMPRKDGITLCREVKKNVETSHIPVVLLTAKTGVESRLQGADAGADLYFEKPLDLSLLKISLQNIFKRQQQLRERYAQSYYASIGDLSSNRHDNEFLKKLTALVGKNLGRNDMDVNFIASSFSMSQATFYNKLKKLTGKSPVEFVVSYRMRTAAKMIVEKDMTMTKIKEMVGIESNAYFTNAFKREFGMTPSTFAEKYKGKKNVGKESVA
ncbi:MAG: response regulator [Prevotellaceae bacterium]|jgi:signal transduction histidine kinase/ligand-binding sensor domain-containing protein/CheY-like chemotaxis protein/AraC-like DNA-binding protein|nr:response regulator [Prevotellaceae bacterium]